MGVRTGRKVGDRQGKKGEIKRNVVCYDVKEKGERRGGRRGKGYYERW